MVFAPTLTLLELASWILWLATYGSSDGIRDPVMVAQAVVLFTIATIRGCTLGRTDGMGGAGMMAPIVTPRIVAIVNSGATHGRV